MKTTRPTWAWFILPHLMLMVLATVLACTDHLPRFLQAIPYVDKVFHFGLYGGFAFLAVALFHRTPWHRVVVVIGCLAAIEEVSQAFFPHRTLDAYDLLANLAGIMLLGTASAHLVHRRNGVSLAVRPSVQAVE